MIESVSLSAAVPACLRILMIAVVISSLEPLVAWRFFSSNGPLWWKLARLERSQSGRRPVALIAHDSVFRALCVIDIGAALAVAVRPDSRVGWLLVIVHGLTIARMHDGLDGSDAMTGVLLVANAIRLVDPAKLQTSFVLFVAVQAALAYFTSGFSKLGSWIWVEGLTLRRTLSTTTYGEPGFARLLWARPWIGRMLSWLTFTIEIIFPIALVAPPPVAVTIVGIMAAFHLGCARIMALGSFVWAFGATYPCVLAARPLIHGSPTVRTSLAVFAVIMVALQLQSSLATLSAINAATEEDGQEGGLDGLTV